MSTLITVRGDSLTVRYTGPHRVLKQTTAVDFLIELLGTRKEQRILLVHMSRRYYTRVKFIEVSQNVDKLRKYAVKEYKDLTTEFKLSPLEDANIADDEDIKSVILSSVTTILKEKLSHL